MVFVKQPHAKEILLLKKYVICLEKVGFSPEKDCF
jgi:hypothetical protein